MSGPFAWMERSIDRKVAKLTAFLEADQELIECRALGADAVPEWRAALERRVAEAYADLPWSARAFLRFKGIHVPEGQK